MRRSSRARAAPEVYKPAWVLTDQGRITSVDELDETREGDEFQAALPDVRPRPGATPADELPWMQPPIPTGKFKACTWTCTEAYIVMLRRETDSSV